MRNEPDMKQIICMKWGTAYSADYVNRLYSMVVRNITGPFRFVCLTDDIDGLRPEVEAFPCPTIALPSPYFRKPWRKVTLWGPTVPGLNPGHALFIDLDVVVTGPIDDFFEFEKDKTFVVINNWTQPGQGIGNTSVYRFQAGSHPYLLENLEADPLKHIRKHGNSQTYISRNIREMAFWPEEWCRSFKVHCIPRGLGRYFLQPSLPEGARIVAFPGDPNPPEAARGRWPAPWYKRVYKQFRPAVWVDEHWR
jgi:hypothetical protein